MSASPSFRCSSIPRRRAGLLTPRFYLRRSCDTCAGAAPQLTLLDPAIYRNDRASLKRVLLVGSGGLSIGQAGNLIIQVRGGVPWPSDSLASRRWRGGGRESIRSTPSPRRRPPRRHARAAQAPRPSRPSRRRASRSCSSILTSPRSKLPERTLVPSTSRDTRASRSRTMCTYYR